MFHMLLCSTASKYQNILLKNDLLFLLTSQSCDNITAFSATSSWMKFIPAAKGPIWGMLILEELFLVGIFLQDFLMPLDTVTANLWLMGGYPSPPPVPSETVRIFALHGCVLERSFLTVAG